MNDEERKRLAIIGNERAECLLCVFFSQTGRDGFGQCRKLPPRIDAEGETRWPRVSVGWWCGEWISIGMVDDGEDVDGEP
jgi:hypothetical protein